MAAANFLQRVFRVRQMRRFVAASAWLRRPRHMYQPFLRAAGIHEGGGVVPRDSSAEPLALTREQAKTLLEQCWCTCPTVRRPSRMRCHGACASRSPPGGGAGRGGGAGYRRDGGGAGPRPGRRGRGREAAGDDEERAAGQRPPLASARGWPAPETQQGVALQCILVRVMAPVSSRLHPCTHPMQGTITFRRFWTWWKAHPVLCELPADAIRAIRLQKTLERLEPRDGGCVGLPARAVRCADPLLLTDSLARGAGRSHPMWRDHLPL